MLFVDELAILSRYAHDEGAVVQGVSFCLGEGQSLAIVGESGFGQVYDCGRDCGRRLRTIVAQPAKSCLTA